LKGLTIYCSQKKKKERNCERESFFSFFFFFSNVLRKKQNKILAEQTNHSILSFRTMSIVSMSPLMMMMVDGADHDDYRVVLCPGMSLLFC